MVLFQFRSLIIVNPTYKKMLFYRITRMFSSFPQIYPYLAESIKANNFLPLRNNQIKCLQLAPNHNNIFINQQDGQGKTLSYLLPILNELIIRKKEQKEQQGAIIVTINKQLALQIYQLIRRLDPSKMLQVNRCGSIIHYSPVIEEMCKPAKQQDRELIGELMDKNVAESVRWPNTDILVTTPKILYRILEQKIENKKTINAQHIVIDEADVILKNRDLLTYVNKSVGYLQKIKKGMLRYYLAAPEKQCSKYLIQKQCKLPTAEKFVFTDCIQKDTIKDSLRVGYVKIKNVNASKQELLKNKLEMLIRLISSKQRKRLLIFCQKSNFDQVKNEIMNKANIIPTQFYAGLSTEKRTLALFSYIEGNSNLIISTDLASRGLNLGKEIDTIITFDFGTLQDQKGRMSRCNKSNSQHIFFVEQDNSTERLNLIHSIMNTKMPPLIQMSQADISESIGVIGKQL